MPTEFPPLPLSRGFMPQALVNRYNNMIENIDQILKRLDENRELKEEFRGYRNKLFESFTKADARFTTEAHQKDEIRITAYHNYLNVIQKGLNSLISVNPSIVAPLSNKPLPTLPKPTKEVVSLRDDIKALEKLMGDTEEGQEKVKPLKEALKLLKKNINESEKYGLLDKRASEYSEQLKNIHLEYLAFKFEKKLEVAIHQLRLAIDNVNEKRSGKPAQNILFAIRGKKSPDQIKLRELEKLKAEFEKNKKLGNIKSIGGYEKALKGVFEPALKPEESKKKRKKPGKDQWSKN